MTIVLQLTRKLTARPHAPTVAGVRVRTFDGEQDVEAWLNARRRAFARQRVGVRDWDAADFAREFLRKPWWRPSVMWFAETEGNSPQIVGTVTLARRGESDDAMPVVHWLAVVPRERRRGVGRLLMATLEAAAWDAGERQLWLETHAQWAEALRLYQALGYEPVEH